MIQHLSPEAERLIDHARRGDGAALIELLTLLTIETRTHLSRLPLTADNVPIASQMQGQIEAWESLHGWLTTRMEPAVRQPQRLRR